MSDRFQSPFFTSSPYIKNNVLSPKRGLNISWDPSGRSSRPTHSHRHVCATYISNAKRSRAARHYPKSLITKYHNRQTRSDLIVATWKISHPYPGLVFLFIHKRKRLPKGSERERERKGALLFRSPKNTMAVYIRARVGIATEFDGARLSCGLRIQTIELPLPSLIFPRWRTAPIYIYIYTHTLPPGSVATSRRKLRSERDFLNLELYALTSVIGKTGRGRGGARIPNFERSEREGGESACRFVSIPMSWLNVAQPYVHARSLISK